MPPDTLLAIALGTLLGSPVLAVAAAWAARARLRVVPGEGARVMPGLPERPALTGSAARRFDASVRRAERRAVRLLLRAHAGPRITGVDAAALSASLGVEPEISRALLEDWRGRLPCRLQVTERGRLLHDFPREAVARAVVRGWHSWPQRVALFVAAVIANLGATWWVLVGVASAAVSLTAVWQAEGEGPKVVAAILGIGLLVAIFAVAETGAWFIRALQWGTRPHMAPARRPASDERPASARTAMAKPGPSTSKSRWWDDLDLGGVDAGAEGCGLVVLLVCVAVLAAALVGGLVVVGVWARGLWRSAKRFGEPEGAVAPGDWLAQAARSSFLERWVPTNDLAVRLVRALGRMLRGRPGDDDLGRRVLTRCRPAGDTYAAVGALEVALHEGLASADALTLLAQLVARLDGDLQVTEAGDVVALLPRDAARAASAAPVPPGGSVTGRGRPEYLGDAPEKTAGVGLRERLPVNVPGLTRAQVDAASRLAGGPLVTLVGLTLALLFAPSELPVPAGELGLLALFCVLVPGTLTLAVVTRAAVAMSARHGLLRDVRRHAVAALRHALDTGAAEVDSRALAGRLAAAVAPHAPGWGDLSREVEAVWADLGLEPGGVDGAEPSRWAVAPLRTRLDAIAAAATPAATRATADPVVYDSHA